MSARFLLAPLLVTPWGCAPEGPALVVSLQITEGTDIDTSDVTGFLIRVGDAETPILLSRNSQVEIELLDPPNGPTDFVVFACEGNAACRAVDASFVGCATADLQPSDTPQTVFVALFPAPAAGEPPPPGCAGRL